MKEVTYIVHIDYHSHILPEIDDGAKSFQKAEKLICAAHRADIKTIYATPHFYGHKMSVDTFCSKCERAASKLEKNIDVEIKLGAEILLFPGIEKMPKLEWLTYERSNRLLIELPLSQELITEEHLISAEALAEEFEIVLAHANRYSDESVEQFLAMGAILQINVSDACRLKEKSRIDQWKSRGAVLCLGSDAHNSSNIYRRWQKAYELLERK